jgi:pentose-5-phosphate-3-epimerase
MRAAQIKDGVVINFCFVEEFTEEFIETFDYVDIGDIWDGKKFSKPIVVKTRDEKKVERQAQVDRLTVTVDGMVFDGDEESQNRMVRAIAALTFASKESTTWVLNNNTAVEVTLDQLSRALVEAGKAQTAVWVI